MTFKAFSTVDEYNALSEIDKKLRMQQVEQIAKDLEEHKISRQEAANQLNKISTYGLTQEESDIIKQAQRERYERTVEEYDRIQAEIEQQKNSSHVTKTSSSDS